MEASFDYLSHEANLSTRLFARVATSRKSISELWKWKR